MVQYYRTTYLVYVEFEKHESGLLQSNQIDMNEQQQINTLYMQKST